MADGKITDTYLPQQHLGIVEARLLRIGGTLVSRIYTAGEIEETFSLQLCAAPIDSCIRNITHRFPDGPTYYLIVASGAVNALIARFDGFQCIVLAEGVHVRATVMIVSLMSSASLTTYLDTGVEPLEPSSAPARSRDEALVQLAEVAGPMTEDARRRTAAICFFLLYFLTAHELGHLALGHLDRKPEGSMDEVSDNGESKIASRAMEWDADSFAMNATLYLTGSEFRQQELWRDMLSDTEAALRLLSVMTYVLFTLMDSMGPQDRPAEDRTHPRPLVRVGLANFNLAAVMSGFGSVDGSVVMDTNRAAIRAVEIALHELAGGVMERALATQLGEELEVEAERLVATLGGELWTQLDRSRLKDLHFAKALQMRPVMEAAPD